MLMKYQLPHVFLLIFICIINHLITIPVYNISLNALNYLYKIRKPLVQIIVSSCASLSISAPVFEKFIINIKYHHQNINNKNFCTHQKFSNNKRC